VWVWGAGGGGGGGGGGLNTRNTTRYASAYRWMQLIVPKRHNVAKIQPSVTSHKTTIFNVIAVSISSVARRDRSRQIHSLTDDFSWEYKQKFGSYLEGVHGEKKPIIWI